jgi:RAD54-like protein 2
MLNFTRKEVENLLHFVEKEPAPQTSLNVKGIKESVLQLACLKYPHLITKVSPWHGILSQGRLV